MSRKRGYFFTGLVGLVLVFLVGRLAMLQLIEGKHYQVLADENRVQLIKLKADRGVIYDRYGEVLARNGPEGREYVYGKAMAHVLGYVAEADEEEVESGLYSLGEIVGKLGIEKKYDQWLRGEEGGVLVEKDANGAVLREIGRKEPVVGKSLSLSLDAGLQRKAAEILGGRQGALVASNPNTGEILALVSSPSFDPKQVADYLKNKNLPLFDRAISGEYPPGSVFKMVTATAALEEGKIDETTEIEDTGEIRIGLYRFGNWYFDQYGRKEGVLRIVRAIARSNDIFFYKLGELLGIEALDDWAKYFGLGERTGVDLLGEANGLVPSPEWKEEYKGEAWYLGDTYITAIGQGNILTTPLQVNQMTNVIASGGWLCQPYLAALELEGGKSKNCQHLDISDKTIALVKEGMKEVCETGGTAFPFFDFRVNGKRIYVGAKTGTAEFGDPEKRTHAWFSVMAPVENPEITVTVLLEAAGEGSSEAAPVARELLSYWFSRQ
jgi:penicillin-binding protein 2